MNIKPVKTADAYQKIADAPAGKKEDIYRYELAMPFQHMWDCYNIPIKAAKPGGYDVVMASEMLGLLPVKDITNKNVFAKQGIAFLKNETLWQTAANGIQTALGAFTDNGVQLQVQGYLFALMLANPESPYTKANGSVCGNGGIPGYITLSIMPDADVLSKLPAVLAHECNHNARLQYVKWPGQRVTLADMLVTEGIAENFATHLYGEASAGKWVRGVTDETMQQYVKPLMKDALNTQGFDEITAWLYGDEMAALQQFPAAGMPYCAGYAAGYTMIQYVMQHTGKSIYELTTMPTSEILRLSTGFWDA